MPFLLRKLYKSRVLIEDQFTRAVGTERLEGLTKYYGTSPFRCSLVQCPYFVAGFETCEDREMHHNSHLRLFKCTHETCDYFVIGFPSEAALRKHLRLCHVSPSPDLVFPSIKSQPLEKALQGAIRENNLTVVKALSMELACFSARKKGFILQAITLRQKDAASILVDSLGTPAEIDHIENNTTALLKACEIGDDDLLKKLLQKGCNINIGDNISAKTREKDFHPISIAAQNGHVGIVRILMGQKDLIMDQSFAAWTRKGALALAAAEGFSEIVALLLESHSERLLECPLRYPYGDFVRAVNAAMRSDHISTAEFLLNWGLDNNIITNFVPEGSKISENNIEEITEILNEQYRELDEKGGTRGIRLHNLAFRGDAAGVSRLLDMGADIEKPNSSGTPLMHAASYGQLEVVQLLIDRGANIMTLDIGSNRSEGSAIDHAAVYGKETVVRELLAKGAKFTFQSMYPNLFPNRHEPRNYILLQKCASGESAPIVRLLLEQGANVEALEGKRNNGKTPLLLAAQGGHYDSIRALLEYGADINAIYNKKTALMLAIEGWSHLNDGRAAVIELLIDKGINIDMVDEDGDTALMISAHRNRLYESLRIFQIILKKGADISIRNTGGETVLMIAAANTDFDVIECLLQENPEYYINKVEEIGDSLNLVFSRRYYKLLEMQHMSAGSMKYMPGIIKSSVEEVKKSVEVLLEFGSNMDSRDGRYAAALSKALAAAKLEYLPDVISLLLKYGAVDLDLCVKKKSS